MKWNERTLGRRSAMNDAGSERIRGKRSMERPLKNERHARSAQHRLEHLPELAAIDTVEEVPDIELE